MKFSPDRAPVPGDLRIAWRLPLLLLIVEKCWGRRATWTQLHVMSWAVLSRMAAEDLKDLLAGTAGWGQRIAAVDPAVNLAVDFAIGQGLLRLAGERVALTGSGNEALREIRNAQAFAVERAILDALPGKVTAANADIAMAGVR